MAFKAGKYVSQRWTAVEDGPTREALQDQNQRTQALATDVAPLLVPQGAIILWDQSPSCPLGYTEVTSLRSLFPRGWDGSILGAVGGSATHNHGGVTGTPSATVLEIDGTGTSHNVADPLHTHTIGSASNLPPFYTLLFCRKN